MGENIKTISKYEENFPEIPVKFWCKSQRRIPTKTALIREDPRQSAALHSTCDYLVRSAKAQLELPALHVVHPSA